MKPKEQQQVLEYKRYDFIVGYNKNKLCMYRLTFNKKSIIKKESTHRVEVCCHSLCCG